MVIKALNSCSSHPAPGAQEHVCKTNVIILKCPWILHVYVQQGFQCQHIFQLSLRAWNGRGCFKVKAGRHWQSSAWESLTLRYVWL